MVIKENSLINFNLHCCIILMNDISISDVRRVII